MAYKSYSTKKRARRNPRSMGTRRPMAMKNTRMQQLHSARKLNLRSDIHYMSRYAPLVDTTTLTTATAAAGAFLSFTLNDVPNATDFTNLFENYRIIGVLLTFRLMDNPDSTNYISSTVFTQGSNFYPKLWTVVDRDDSTPPTLATIRERPYARCRILRPDRFIKVFVKYPRPIIATASGVTYTNPPRESWFRTSEPTVSHFGLKVVLDKMGYAGTTFTVGIDRKYFFALKGSK